MRRKHKIKPVKSKCKKPKVRLPGAPPSIRHGAKRGTGYDRLREKVIFRSEINEL
jgi:hypothetical protein